MVVSLISVLGTVVSIRQKNIRRMYYEGKKTMRCREPVLDLFLASLLVWCVFYPNVPAVVPPRPYKMKKYAKLAIPPLGM